MQRRRTWPRTVRRNGNMLAPRLGRSPTFPDDRARALPMRVVKLTGDVAGRDGRMSVESFLNELNDCSSQKFTPLLSNR
jgi:hypothetical protein